MAEQDKTSLYADLLRDRRLMGQLSARDAAESTESGITHYWRYINP